MSKNDPGKDPAAPGAAPQAEEGKSPKEEKSEGERERLAAEIANRDDALLRMQAELQNVRKRHERDRIRDARYRSEPLARELLDVVDALDEAVEIARGDDHCPEAVREGQELIRRSLGSILERFSVHVLDPRGEVFNPEEHEAMGMQADDRAAPGTVLTVLRKGYRLHDRLLRPARVLVAEEPRKTGKDGESGGNGVSGSP